MSEPRPSPEHTPSKTLGARVLRVFADVKRDEVVTVVLMTATVFVLLAAYYFLKVIREGLILAEGTHGAQVKSYASGAQAALLIPFVQGFSALARRFERLKLMAVMAAFYSACLVGFMMARVAGVHIGVPFYLFVGIFNVAAVAQFWSFANDVYTPEQGKRLFAIIGIGSSLGAVAGSFVAKPVYKALGVVPMLVVVVVCLFLCVVIMRVVDSRERARGDAARKAAGAPEEAPKGVAGKGAFGLLLRDRYLLLIAAMTLVYNCVNSTGEYILGETLLSVKRAEGVTDPQALEAAVIGFSSTYFGWVNIIGLALQAFATSRVLKYIGVRGALFVMP
jgi:AAA family ATP:ADP antiporter